MPYYLVQAAYAPSSMAALIQSPQDRPKMLRAVLERLGGTLESAWLAFGEYDAMLICQMPSPQAMAAFSIAVSAGGGVRAIKTTPLLSWDEGMLAMRQAAQAGYQPPGQ